MADVLHVDIRTARQAVITDAFDAGSGAALLKVFTGTRPAFDGTETTIIVQTTYSDPAWPADNPAGVTANAINGANASSTGTPSWYRIEDSAGKTIIDGDVVASGNGLILNGTAPASITSGDPVTFTHTIAEGNVTA